MGLGCHRTSELSGELPRVHSNLNDVVNKCQQGCQGEGGDEQCDETKLYHWDAKRREVSEKRYSGNSTICRISVFTASIYQLSLS